MLPLSQPGKYALLAELGRGGMATAYLAAMQGPGGFNKLMVVKRLRPALATEPEFLRMFLQEARLAARIDHPNVVHTSEVGFDGEDYFIAMEYIEGQSLENLWRRVVSRAAGLSIPPSSLSATSSNSLVGATPTATSAVSVIGAMIPLPIHLSILTQVLAGLDFAHELKDFDGNPLAVVHRDVSPHNVMVTYEGHVKLVDFGIAKAADSNGDTRTGVMKGKCAYMPAEQFGGKVDRRADIFAVGVMLWQALTGRRLWKGLSDAEVFQRLSRNDIPTPSSVKPDVNLELEALCMKALSYSPEDRFATAADFQAAIEDVVAGDRTLRASARETGKFVAELFAADREKVRGVIEEELGSRAVGEGKNVPSALPRIGSTTGSLSALSDLRATHASATSASQVLDTTVEIPARRTGRLAVIGATAVAALGVLAFAAFRSPAANGGDFSATGIVAPPAVLSVAEAPSVLERTLIAATPANARILVDGALLENATFSRDGKRHMVSVESDGYETHSEWVVFDRERIEVTLTQLETEKNKAGGRVRWTPPSKTKTDTSAAKTEPVVVAPPTTPAPAASKKGMGLDTGDPWAK